MSKYISGVVLFDEPLARMRLYGIPCEAHRALRRHSGHSLHLTAEGGPADWRKEFLY